LEQIDLCELALSTADFTVPPTSRLELVVTTFGENPASATLLVGGAEDSRLEFPEGTLQERAEPIEELAQAEQESPGPPLAVLLGALALGLLLRRRAGGRTA